MVIPTLSRKRTGGWMCGIVCTVQYDQLKPHYCQVSCGPPWHYHSRRNEIGLQLRCHKQQTELFFQGISLCQLFFQGISLCRHH